MAYSISSLLEHPNIAGTDVETTNEQLHSNFWVAYDALDLNSKHNLHLIFKGIEQAKEM